MAKQVSSPDSGDRWYSFIFKSPELARRWIPIIESTKQQVTPDIYEQSVNKLICMDYDQVFMLDPEPNVIPVGTENAEGNQLTLEDIKKMMCQMSDGSLSFVAKCKCGKLTGNYNKDMICPDCHTKCVGAISEDVNFGAWMEIPREMPPLLHPVAYRILRAWMGKMSRRSEYLLDAFLDPHTDLPEPYAGVCGQGMIYFSKWDNFMSVINMVMQQHRGKKSAADKVIQEFIDTYKWQMFTRHIPILNQSLHILTQSGTMTYDDDSLKHIFQTWLELNSAIMTIRHRSDVKETWISEKTWSVYKCWMNYIDSIIEPKLTGKTGFIRKNMLGGRMNASGRGVIVPITRLHFADDIELPWKMVVGFYKLEIMNILENRFGWGVNKACDQFNLAVVRYIPEIDACLNILKDECPFVGFPVLMGRNPTLRHGAIQLWFSRRHKTDPKDNTVGMSPEALSCPNADFDGDSLYLLSLKELITVVDCMKIHPASTLLGGEGGELFPSVKMPSENAVSANNWLVAGMRKGLDSYKKAAGL